MNPNVNLQRGLLLYEQGRFALAEVEFRQHLSVEPGDSFAHSMLALCLAERKEFQEATDEARQAIHHGPDSDYSHYAMARVFYARNRYPEALRHIEEAIRLNADDPDYFAWLAAIQLAEYRWKEALEAAERGLRISPEHPGCANLRAMALVKLGRKIEASASIDAALSKNPDNSSTHANKGWTLLEENQPKKALEHFRESLRLDPENNWARRGIVEALKARYFIYAWMLRYFLWMSKLSPRVQWGVILGAFFGNRLLGVASDRFPELAPWLWPIRILYVLFVILTWTADPLFNLCLRVNRFGRLALSREQIVASNWLGACILLSLLSLGAGLALPSVLLIGSAVVFGLLVLPVTGTFKCREGWPRHVMTLYTAGLAVIGLLSFTNKNMLDLFGTFVVGVFLSGWIVNFLATVKHRH